MASKAHLTFNSTAYNRRDSFGLGWADQWDYKFNDEKLMKSNSHSSCSKMANPSSSSSSSTTTTAAGAATTGLFTSKLGIGNIGTKSLSSSSSSLLRPAKFGKENRISSSNSSSSSSSSSLVHKSPLGSSKKLADINKKVTSAANSSAHKVKSSTHMGIKWLKKQCSLKTLKSSDHSS